MTETTDAAKPCDRGCTERGRHSTDCDNRECRGCLPRLREFGRLCYTCHIRLAEAVQTAPAQIGYLMVNTRPSVHVELSQQTTAKIPDGWRTTATSTDGETVDPPPSRMHARTTPSAPQEGEPIRIACLDAATELADTLSEFVDHIAARLDHAPPPILASVEERTTGDRRRKAWVGTTDRDGGRYVWIDPDPAFATDSAASWLLARLAAWEQLETVSDDAEVLFDISSRAHALAPWREESKRLSGIPCPYCKRKALQRFGGKVDVTCTWCERDIPPERYLIWARAYEESVDGSDVVWSVG